MTEWWTYRPGDFLMFSPRIYWRLFEDINGATWPLPVLAVVLGVAALGWCWRRPGSERVVGLAALLLAAAWGHVAWAFLWQRFAPIQWVASSFAVAFAVQAAAVLASCWQARWTGTGPGAEFGVSQPGRRAGLALAAWATVLHPLLAGVQGRPWQQGEVFGLAPDPTALATLAWLLMTPATSPMARRWRALLWVIPVLWCVVSAAQLFTMGALQGAVPLAGVGLALAALHCGRHTPKRE